MRAAANELIARAANNHASIARQLAPVDTGYLRDHIAVKVEGGVYEVISGAEYSTYVEFGTTYSEAQPFFYPAFGSALRQLREEAKDVVGDRVSKAR